MDAMGLGHISQFPLAAVKVAAAMMGHWTMEDMKMGFEAIFLQGVVARWAPWTHPVFEWGEITDSYIYMAENDLKMDKSGVITLLIGVLTPFITGRGSPCWTLLRYMYSIYLGDTEFALLKCWSVSCSSMFSMKKNDKHIRHARMPNKAQQLYRGRYITNQNNAPL